MNQSVGPKVIEGKTTNEHHSSCKKDEQNTLLLHMLACKYCQVAKTITKSMWESRYGESWESNNQFNNNESYNIELCRIIFC